MQGTISVESTVEGAMITICVNATPNSARRVHRLASKTLPWAKATFRGASAGASADCLSNARTVAYPCSSRSSLIRAMLACTSIRSRIAVFFLLRRTSLSPPMSSTFSRCS
ncbi:hypothetical protein D3C76_973730 [compost metagenome]